MRCSLITTILYCFLLPLTAFAGDHSTQTVIHVSLPEDALLYVDGVKTTSGGSLRTLYPPDDLRLGRHVYTFVATVKRSGKVLRHERIVSFMTGEELRINFDFPTPLLPTPVNQAIVDVCNTFLADDSGPEALETLARLIDLDKPYSLACTKRFSDGCAFLVCGKRTLRISSIEPYWPDPNRLMTSFLSSNNIEWWWPGWKGESNAYLENDMIDQRFRVTKISSKSVTLERGSQVLILKPNPPHGDFPPQRKADVTEYQLAIKEKIAAARSAIPSNDSSEYDDLAPPVGANMNAAAHARSPSQFFYESSAPAIQRMVNPFPYLRHN